MTTLLEAQEWLRDRLEEGATCPCCKQHAQLYKRPLGSSMASALIQLYRKDAYDYLKIVDHLTTNQNADAAKLVYWGLIESPGGVREDGSTRVGWWRLTDKGRAFVLSQVRVPAHARVYAQRCLGLGGDLVSIRYCLGKRFNYDDLMNGIG